MEFGWGTTGNEVVSHFKDKVAGKTCMPENSL